MIPRVSTVAILGNGNDYPLMSIKCGQTTHTTKYNIYEYVTFWNSELGNNFYKFLCANKKKLFHTVLIVIPT